MKPSPVDLKACCKKFVARFFSENSSCAQLEFSQLRWIPVVTSLHCGGKKSIKTPKRNFSNLCCGIIPFSTANPYTQCDAHTCCFCSNEGKHNFLMSCCHIPQSSTFSRLFQHSTEQMQRNQIAKSHFEFYMC